MFLGRVLSGWSSSSLKPLSPSTEPTECTDESSYEGHGDGPSSGGASEKVSPRGGIFGILRQLRECWYFRSGPVPAVPGSVFLRDSCQVTVEESHRLGVVICERRGTRDARWDLQICGSCRCRHSVVSGGYRK